MLEKARRLLQPSARSSAVPAFMVMDVMAAAGRLEAQGRRIIHMEVGQPAVGAPSSAIAAARAALTSGPLGYTETLGVGSLRQRIARSYGDRHGLDIDPARVIVTTGSSAGFMLALLAAFAAGDRVAVALPGYPPYRHILSALGCEPVLIETSAQTRWSITADALLAAHRERPLKGVIVASVEPNSPAAEKGLQPGDVLEEVNQQAVSAPGEVSKAIDALKKAGKKSALMLVANGSGDVRFVALAIE